MTPREKIAQQALALGPEDRVYLADVLEQSLAAGGFATAEIDRRVAAYDRGEVQAADFETALAHIRQHLGDHRSRKGTS